MLQDNPKLWGRGGVHAEKGGCSQEPALDQPPSLNTEMEPETHLPAFWQGPGAETVSHTHTHPSWQTEGEGKAHFVEDIHSQPGKRQAGLCAAGNSLEEQRLLFNARSRMNENFSEKEKCPLTRIGCAPPARTGANIKSASQQLIWELAL